MRLDGNSVWQPRLQWGLGGQFCFVHPGIEKTLPLGWIAQRRYSLSVTTTGGCGLAVDPRPQALMGAPPLFMGDL
jgi:hypothetical protein